MLNLQIDIKSKIVFWEPDWPYSKLRIQEVPLEILLFRANEKKRKTKEKNPDKPKHCCKREKMPEGFLSFQFSKGR